MSGLLAIPALGPYCMSKFALEAFSDTLRLELRPWGIRVIHLQPGQIATPIWDKGLEAGSDAVANLPEEVVALYGPLLAATRAVAETSRREAKPVATVSRAVVHAFTARRPRRRYVMGGSAWTQKVIARLPTAWRDTLLAKSLGLPG